MFEYQLGCHIGRRIPIDMELHERQENGQRNIMAETDDGTQIADNSWPAVLHGLELCRNPANRHAFTVVWFATLAIPLPPTTLGSWIVFQFTIFYDIRSYVPAPIENDGNVEPSTRASLYSIH